MWADIKEFLNKSVKILWIIIYSILLFLLLLLIAPLLSWLFSNIVMGGVFVDLILKLTSSS